MKVDHKIRLLTFGDHGCEPAFERMVLGIDARIGGLVPFAVQVGAQHVEARPAVRDAVLVGHGHNVHAVGPAETSGVGIIAQQPLDQTLNNPVSARFPGMGPRPQEHAVRCGRVADANDFQLASLNGLADRGDLDARVSANLPLERLQVREPVGFEPGHIEQAALAGDGDFESIGRRRLGGQRPPCFRVLRDEADRSALDGRTLAPVPHVVEVVQNDSQLGAGGGLKLKEPVAVGPVRGIALLVVHQIHVNETVGIRCPVQGRGVLKTRVDVRQLRMIRHRAGRGRDRKQPTQGKHRPWKRARGMGSGNVNVAYRCRTGRVSHSHTPLPCTSLPRAG